MIEKDRRVPSLRVLKTFHIASKRGSFKPAADELCVTASEQDLDVALF
jgi:DNA-binding transcriptional LysR family regulator